MHDIILKKQLNEQFNIPSFRTGQEEIIKDVLNGNDVLGVLPTGSGKSLCYQLPATMMDGLTIVVSPLISLMQDQVKQLRATGFKAVEAINSFMAIKEKKQTLQNLNKYKLIYISPELLLQPVIKKHLRNVRVSLFVIDEAHCISQWGHEFRPDYLRLGTMIDYLKNPPILALSATATREVQNDIAVSLNRPVINRHIYPMDRENIVFTVEHLNNDAEKQHKIAEILEDYRVPTLVYFSSKRKAEEIAAFLARNLPDHRIAFYHGGMDQTDRISIQQQFMNDQLDVVCCTSAFGMGINKQDIRLIIHYHFPLQIESFIQEIGRAGRDGKSSVSLLLYADGDEYLPNALIENELPAPDMLKEMFSRLYQLYKQAPSLPDATQIMEILQISETQWRFLHHQLEGKGIINGNELVFSGELWKTSYHEIYRLVVDRVKLKEQKLWEMTSWIHYEGCLRKKLYQSFQDDFKAPLAGCCSNCGYSISTWEPEQSNYSTSAGSWQNKLKKLLLSGVDHAETK
ncbi:RecQ family ATP-dependent DNA helicase [Virgibacillus kekensis]|uniref:RecQ family ATP-dependent DNA helicase n=1 Tax=Virgibacillus kekensis TaxID=202261 RepID=A0ABV9DF55_9BACI